MLARQLFAVWFVAICVCVYVRAGIELAGIEFATLLSDLLLLQAIGRYSIWCTDIFVFIF